MLSLEAIDTDVVVIVAVIAVLVDSVAGNAMRATRTASPWAAHAHEKSSQLKGTWSRPRVHPAPFRQKFAEHDPAAATRARCLSRMPPTKARVPIEHLQANMLQRWRRPHERSAHERFVIDATFAPRDL